VPLHSLLIAQLLQPPESSRRLSSYKEIKEEDFVDRWAPTADEAHGWKRISFEEFLKVYPELSANGSRR
jgi:hypothetical protein